MSGFTGIVDVHSHAVLDFGQKAPMANQPEWSPEKAIALMDQNGIAKSIISLPFAANYAEGAEARDLARQVNEQIADVVAKHPTRFGGMVTLPGRDIDGALTEMAYALDVLKLDAVATTTNINDVYLGDKTFDPWFEELNRRGATLFIHPINLSTGRLPDLDLNYALMEFMFDTTRMLVNMIATGTKARFPDIKMITTHAGGTLPFLVQRVQMLLTSPTLGLGPEGPSAAEIKTLFASFYYDLTAATSSAQLGALLELVPASQLLMGVDIPFMPDATIGPAIRAINDYPGFSQAELAMIAHENAAGLFASCAKMAAGAS